MKVIYKSIMIVREVLKNSLNEVGRAKHLSD